MPRWKQVRRKTLQDMRTILRLTHEQELSAHKIAERLKLSKTTVTAYSNRVRDVGLNLWPLPKSCDYDTTLKQMVFQRVGHPPQDLTEPNWPKIEECRISNRELQVWAPESLEAR